jgi:hypothetical protein
VHHESGESPQDLGQVVWRFRPPAFGVGDGNQAINTWKEPQHALQPIHDLPGQRRGARRRAKNHDHVSRSDTTGRRSSESRKGTRGRYRFDRHAGSKRGLVQFERLNVILKVRPFRKLTIQGPDFERLQHRAIADVVPRAKIANCPTKGKPPRQEHLTLYDCPDGEPMALEHGVGKDQHRIAENEA